MKQISDKEIEQIKKVLVEVNVPVQVFISLQRLFEKLPAVEEKKD